MIHRPNRRAAALACALALAAAGCASANKRMEQGQALEQQGRAAGAARRYVDALKKDPSLAEARAHLLDAGNRAVGDYLRETDASAGAGNYAAAADALLALDGLRRDAAAVGQPLQPPADYDAHRRTILDHAADQALAFATDAVQRRDYAEAVRLLDRAGEKWEPAADRAARIGRARYDAHLAWAGGEMEAGRYRSAFEHAGSAAGVQGVDDAGRAAAIQAEALRRGTVRVAVFPVGALRGTGAGARERILPELNDALALSYWQRSPRWLAVLNPVEASRIARERGYGGEDVDPGAAARMGRDLGADLAVVMTLDSIRRGESDVRTERHAARTRSGADTAYTVREGRAETWARVSWRIVDTRRYSPEYADRGDVSARAAARFRRATYAGDWRDLQLTGDERRLFDGRRDPDDDRETVRSLSDDLSNRLGREVYDALLRRVP